MTLRPLQAMDRDAWLAMRFALWPGSSEADANDWLMRTTVATFVAQSVDLPDTAILGFAEASEREYADGCDTSPVAFLEGWFVQPQYRRQGVGRQLVQAVEEWARSRGLSELASDSLLEDTLAQAAHQASGFRETERAVRYRKPLF